MNHEDRMEAGIADVEGAKRPEPLTPTQVEQLRAELAQARDLINLLTSLCVYCGATIRSKRETRELVTVDQVLMPLAAHQKVCKENPPAIEKRSLEGARRAERDACADELELMARHALIPVLAHAYQTAANALRLGTHRTPSEAGK